VTADGVHLQLTKPEGDLHDKLATEAMVKAVQDFFSAIPNNFAQPNAAVDIDEQGSFPNPSRLSVRDDVGFNDFVPDLYHLRFSAAFVNSKRRQHLRHNRAHWPLIFGPALLDWPKINASPRGQNAFACALA
jgi:hypothetical protein